jgi:hypothetical protein
MRPMRVSWIALLCMAGTAVAADSALDATRRCAEIKDSAQRLACFDRAVQTPPAPAPASVPVPVQPAARSAAPKIVAPAPAPALAPALGDENLQRKERGSKPETPKSLTARITSVQESRPGVFRVTLDNDQVWQAAESKSTFVPAVGDAVQIDKGAMGGYQMARISPAHSGWVRVSRSK